MDATRRSAVAASGRPLIDDVEQAVVDSWDDLLPAAGDWDAPTRAGARAATRALLEQMLRVLADGDLDDRSWSELRSAVFTHDSHEEAGDLVRTVQVVGVDLLIGRVAAATDLTHDDEWQLQREASAFLAQLLAGREEPEPTAVDDLLRALQRSGPDLD